MGILQYINDTDKQREKTKSKNYKRQGKNQLAIGLCCRYNTIIDRCASTARQDCGKYYKIHGEGKLMENRKGRLTLPTDVDMVKETLEMKERL